MSERKLRFEQNLESLQGLMLEVRKEISDLRREREELVKSTGHLPDNLQELFDFRISELFRNVTKRNIHQSILDESIDPTIVSQHMAALGNVERFNILQLLSEKARSFKVIQEMIGLKAGAMKHHLNLLKQVGYITQIKKRGMYTITPDGRLALRLSIWLITAVLQKPSNIDSNETQRSMV